MNQRTVAHGTKLPKTKTASSQAMLSRKKPSTEAARIIDIEEQKTLDRALLRAAEIGPNAKIKRLLKVGADIWARNGGDMNALMLAARRGRTKTCMLLIGWLAERRNDARSYVSSMITQGSYSGHTALMFAKDNKKHETALFLESMPLLLNLTENKENFNSFYSGFRECISQ